MTNNPEISNSRQIILDYLMLIIGIILLSIFTIIAFLPTLSPDPIDQLIGTYGFIIIGVAAGYLITRFVTDRPTRNKIEQLERNVEELNIRVNALE